MIRFFQWLFQGCAHVWREDDRVGVMDTNTQKRIGQAVYCTCTKCGRPKRFKLA